MRTWAVAAIAAAILTTATPAAADWQWTRWGMSPAEVVTASGGKAVPGARGLYVLSEPQVAGGLTFDSVAFSFDDGRLSAVTMVSDDILFIEAEWKLAAAFGEPVVKSDDQGRVRVFVDRAKGNSIRLVETSVGSTLVYSAIPAGF